jgi:serine phosphatase RsbU (regulator of sigma subunit)
MDDPGRRWAAVPASHVIEGLARHLAAEFGATGVELLLVDYRLTQLLPLRHQDFVRHGDTEAARTDDHAYLGTAAGGPAWRAFDNQTPTIDQGAVFIPVSVRGERIGVLRLQPAEALASRLDELAELGLNLAHELAAARPTTDRYVVGARAQRLTLAAEMQWEMLPGRSCSAEQFTLAGQLEPAYAVRGDTFDWALDVDRLSLSVIDGMGEGVAAATLSMLGTSALRNARRAGLGVADQASLADSALYAHYRGAGHLSVLLLEIELATGTVAAIDTGSPLLLVMRGDTITELHLTAHDPLGMFDGSRYQADEFQLEPGDRLVIVSDGVHATSTGDRRYADTDLGRLVRRTRRLPPLEVVRTLITDLRAFVSGDLADDAATMCLDWHGAGSLE